MRTLSLCLLPALVPAAYVGVYCPTATAVNYLGTQTRFCAAPRG